MKTRVAVVFGSRSVEHEVSIITAVQAMNALDEDRFEAIPVDREWSASVTDAAVSSLPVARDLYLNGTRIRVEDYANGAESGVFRIDAQGRVW